VCLQRGTNWNFNYNSGQSLSLKGYNDTTLFQCTFEEGHEAVCSSVPYVHKAMSCLDDPP